jgi:uncharacterized cupin superfamily protein
MTNINVKRIIQAMDKSYDDIKKEQDKNIRLGRLEGLLEFSLSYLKEEIKEKS